MGKKILCAALCILLLLNGTACLAGGYDTEWDPADVYESADAFYAACDELSRKAATLQNYRGKLKDAKTMAEYDALTTELSLGLSKTGLYALMVYSQDPTSADALAAYGRAMSLQADMSGMNAFFDAELAEWTYDERVAIFTSAEMLPYAYAYRKYVDPAYQPMSEDERKTLTAMQQAIGYVQNAYDALLYAEMPDGEYVGADGKTYSISDANLGRVMSTLYWTGDRESMMRAYEAYDERYGDLANTFTSLFQAKLSANWVAAGMEGYDSTRAYCMDAYDVPEAAYDLLVDAFRDGCGALAAYADAHNAVLGVDKADAMQIDLYIAASDYVGVTDYDDCVENVRKALAPLGDAYLSYYDRMVSSGHIDVYPKDNKQPGSFTISALTPETLPFIALNFEGTEYDVGAYAHEMGHAVYSAFTADNQWAGYASPTIFTQEVASLTNEILYYLYRQDAAETDEEALFFNEMLLDLFLNAYYYQMALAEFEDGAYKTVEAGGTLDAETLSGQYMDILTRVYGASMRLPENARYEWVSISHLFESPYYVYQYASAVTYATAIAESVYRGEEGAADRYLAFLKAGASAPVEELLAAAGIDILDPAVYARAIECFEGWTADFIDLTGAGTGSDSALAG